MAVTQVTIGVFKDWLQQQTRIDNWNLPYNVELLNLTTENYTLIKEALLANPRKYVDLYNTYLPSGITNLDYAFDGCGTLNSSPVLPVGVTSLKYTYRECRMNRITAMTIPATVTDMTGTFMNTQLRTPPTIPSSVTTLKECFYGCHGLNSAPNIPYSVTNLDYTFANAPFVNNSSTQLKKMEDIVIPNSVTSMVGTFTDNYLSGAPTMIKIPAIPDSVRNMNACFRGAKFIESITNLPNYVENLESCFENCTNLTEVPSIPNTVTNMDYCFSGCGKITTVPNVPSSVLRMRYAFKNCTLLNKINSFNVNIQNQDILYASSNCFEGCTGLTRGSMTVTDTMPQAQETQDWHVMRLKFGADNVSGSVFDKTGTKTTIPQTAISKGQLKLLIKTDELWFPNDLTDQDIDDLISRVISTKLSYFNKTVIPPDKKNFILYADNPLNFITNLPGMSVVDTIAEGNMQAVTSNAVSRITPVDTVASGNMHSVTSNAVANNNIQFEIDYWSDDVNNPIDVLAIAEGIADISYGSQTVFLRIGGETTNSPYGTANTDFHYEIRKINTSLNAWIQITAYDIRNNVVFTKSKTNGTWGNWYQLQPIVRFTDTSPILTPNPLLEWARMECRNGVYCLYARFANYETQHTFAEGDVIGRLKPEYYPIYGSFSVGTHDFSSNQDYLLWIDEQGYIKIFGIGSQTKFYDFYISATYEL